MLPDWLFWLLVWWGVWFSAFLTYYVKKYKEPIPGLVLFFIFVFSAFIPPMMILGVIVKAIRKTK